MWCVLATSISIYVKMCNTWIRLQVAWIEKLCNLRRMYTKFGSSVSKRKKSWLLQFVCDQMYTSGHWWWHLWHTSTSARNLCRSNNSILSMALFQLQFVRFIYLYTYINFIAVGFRLVFNLCIFCWCFRVHYHQQRMAKRRQSQPICGNRRKNALEKCWIACALAMNLSAAWSPAVWMGDCLKNI